MSYAVQEYPERTFADAFIIGQEFIGDDNVAPRDRGYIFYGQSFQKAIQKVPPGEEGATIFGYGMYDPREYGVVEFDGDRKSAVHRRKPERPKSTYDVPGLYFMTTMSLRL